MEIFFSASAHAFYDTDLHKRGAIPADAIEVTVAERTALLGKMSSGNKRIVLGPSGRPLVEAVPLTLDNLNAALGAAVTKALNDAARAKGYDDISAMCSYAGDTPLQGSLFEERFRLEGNTAKQYRSQCWAIAESLASTITEKMSTDDINRMVALALPAADWGAM